MQIIGGSPGNSIMCSIMFLSTLKGNEAYSTNHNVKRTRPFIHKDLAVMCMNSCVYYILNIRLFILVGIVQSSSKTLNSFKRISLNPPVQSSEI